MSKWMPRRCVINLHRWLVLCSCGKARVCERCGMGEGSIPCERCMRPKL